MEATAFVLVLNIILFSLFFLFYTKRRKKSFDIGYIIVLLYLFLSIFSLVDFLYNPYGDGGSPAGFVSAIYFFLFWIWCFTPVLDYSPNRIANVSAPNMGAMNLFLSFLIIIVIANFIQIVLNFGQLWSNLFSVDFFYDAYSDKVDEFSSETEAVSSSFSFVSVLNNITADIRIFITMYYFSLPKRNKWIVAGLVFALLVSPLSYVLNASRGGLVRMFLLIIAFYFVFKNRYEIKVQHIAKWVIAVFIVLLSAAVTAITISRFTRSFMADDYLLSSISHYLGSPIYNFDSLVLDAGGTRNGDRIFTLFKYVLMPNDGAYTFGERLSRYSYMKIGEDSFSTFIGDVVLDFGPILSIFMAICFIMMLRIMGPFKKRFCHFYHLIPLFMVSYLFLAGWPLCPYADIGGNLKLIFYFMVYLFFYFTRSSHKQMVQSKL